MNPTNSLANDRLLWEKVQEHSDRYYKHLGFTRTNFEVVKNNPIPSDTEEQKSKCSGFLTVTINDKQFSFNVYLINGRKYGGDWKHLIQVFCTNDPKINQITEVTHDFINVISEQWHQLLLEALQGELIVNLKNRISTVNSRNVELWKKVVQRSDEICKWLEITNKDLSLIKDGLKKSFQFTLDDKNFSLDIHRTSGFKYGADWKDMIQVICTDPSLNESLGGGTTFINAVSEKWHRLLLDDPQNGILLEFKTLISNVVSKSFRLWAKVQDHSDEICKRLGITSTEKEEMVRDLAKRLGVSPSQLAYPDNNYKITIENKIFLIFVKDTYGEIDGGRWKCLIQVNCDNDKSINEKTRGGTTSICVISEQWHQSLLAKLEAMVIV